jgi:hypothetical protein
MPAACRREFHVGFLRTHMKYHDYRKAGLPITSSYIESTIKQIHRRVKGAEPLLQFNP